ncbi:ferredoxin [Sedimentitalea sp. JM2-8]|uniref:Ferredoxin n=1 Tax=Sedimentitalea xiamensis TaxID=3050037 RepID=A0ABT7FF50_9RHOB|nr:ferredoxin [Sedimentitalea xiamensis]MDK3073439.1 ferredoxin [Sedimentitalea xiamensis]
MTSTTYDALCSLAEEHGLLVMGALNPETTGDRDGGTLVLLGAGPGFWPGFLVAPESGDGRADPIDRWSLRVIGGMADALGATARYPFGGPPHAPFVAWALASGRAFSSPTGMLVHVEVGLMISYRGALHFPDRIPFPAPSRISPCGSCRDRPCLTACPVGAFSAQAPYDLGACHAYLDTTAGGDCLVHGCAARRACPVSAGAARTSGQSALHMKAFHPK